MYTQGLDSLGADCLHLTDVRSVSDNEKIGKFRDFAQIEDD